LEALKEGRDEYYKPGFHYQQFKGALENLNKGSKGQRPATAMNEIVARYLDMFFSSSFFWLKKR
jgi:1,2-phenylacetyl-CoA epoxidase catalytic subunit